MILPSLIPAKQLTMYSDSKLFQLDPYFLTTCYWIIGGGKHHMTADGIEIQGKEHWVSPLMALKKQVNRPVHQGMMVAQLLEATT